MRHLKTKTLGVGPTDLIPPISTNITALTDCPIRRALKKSPFFGILLLSTYNLQLVIFEHNKNTYIHAFVLSIY